MRPFFMLKKYYKKQNNTFLLVFIFLSVFLLLALFLPISNPIRSTIFNAISPIQRSMNIAGNNLFPTISILKDVTSTKEEIELLKKENRSLLSLLAKTKILEEENEALKALLEFEKEEEKIEIVEVLGREMGTHHITVRHRNEVNINSPVTTPEGVLIGFVVETNKNISQVRLLTSKESFLEAKIITDDYPIGVLKGDNQKTLRIETLPKNKDIKRGDLVVGQSYEGKTLNDIYVGRVINTTDHDIEPFLSADIYQGIDLGYIKYLFVINK